MTSLSDALDRTIAGMASGRDIAIAFSGGLDSGLVAAMASRYAKSVSLYTAGVKDSYDIIEARGTAESLGLGLNELVIGPEDLEDSLREMIRITGETDPITLSFEIPLFYVLKNAREPYIMGGQGADEMFCGYSKYIGLSEKELNEAIIRDMGTLKDRTLVFESKVAEHFGKTILYPYLSDEISEFVSTLSYEEKVPTESIRKRPLKEAAQSLGYPLIASKNKKAAQYGSGSMNLIRKLAKGRGLSVSDYIQSLSEE